LIELRDVTKIYPNGSVGLKDVSVKINTGEFVFVVGSSGSGKSTFIKLLLKELDTSAGSIFINNQNVTNLKRKEIPHLRRKLGVVFQDFRLLPNKTVYENVAFALQVVEASNKEIRRNVPMVLSMVGLQKKAKSFPHQLSGGEQQRAALARAIVNTPPILLADEPTGNLDPETSWEIAKLLNDINARGSTVIVVTHAKDIVDQMKKRVVYISNGEIVQDIEKGGYGYEG
jgi:cell division transport system ATP-binding protein